MAGGDIEISGHVLGDVLSSSGTLRVPGHVDGNIRSYAGNLTLKGTVGRNVMIFGGDVNIDRDAKIGGSITSFTGHESIDGHVKRDVLAMGGQITITGTIGGSAKIKSGELIIDSSAEVGGPRSEERRVGKECRWRGGPEGAKKKETEQGQTMHTKMIE